VALNVRRGSFQKSGKIGSPRGETETGGAKTASVGLRERILLPCVLALAPACGGRSELTTRGVSENDAVVTPTPAPRCLTAGPVAPPSPIGAACAFDAGDRVHVVVSSNARLYGVDGGERVHTLFDFGNGWPYPPGVVSSELVARGEYVAAAVYATNPDETLPSRAVVELLVLDAERKVTFRELLSHEYEGSLDLRITGNEAGLFAFGIHTASATTLFIAGPGGQRLGPFRDLRPESDPDALGRLLVRRDRELNWFDPCAGALSPTRAASIDVYTAMQPQGAQLLYVDPRNATAYSERYDDRAALSLGRTAEPRTSLVHPSSWMLIGFRDSPYSFDLAHVREGRLVEVDIEPPAALRRFRADGIVGFDTAATDELGLDSQGRVLVGFRDDTQGHLYRSDDGTNWEALGLPVGEVRGVAGLERNGTYLIHGKPSGYLPGYWLPPIEGSRRVDFEQVQLVRPSAGTEVVLYQADDHISQTRNFVLSDDGGCAALVLGDNVYLTSAVTGESRTITLPAATVYLDQLAFLSASPSRLDARP
jgi:hypothetical protein